MPPRLALRGVLSHAGGIRHAILTPKRTFLGSRCLSIASIPTSPGPHRSRKFRESPTTRRSASTASASNGDATLAPFSAENPRRELEGALEGLRIESAPAYRAFFDTALGNLREEPGQESISLAVCGLGSSDTGAADPNNGLAAAKSLLRTILADPLGSEQEWERQLAQHDFSKPLLVRIRAHQSGQNLPDTAVYLQPPATEADVLELLVHSPTFNGSSLSIWLGASKPGEVRTPNRLDDSNTESVATFERSALLQPRTLESSSMSREGVHRTLFVADNILGAAQVLRLPLVPGSENVAAAVNLKTSAGDATTGSLFIRVDVDSGVKAIDLFRQDVSNAMHYEALWSQSNLGEAKEWLLAGVKSNDDGETKLAVRQLISTLLRTTLASIPRPLSIDLAQRSQTLRDIEGLDKALNEWASGAHLELEEELNIAFTGRRWRKLGWWKLFWRVDDVGMLSTETIGSRFLPASERGIIYLAGCVQAKLPAQDGPWQSYSLPRSTSPEDGSTGSPTTVTPPPPKTRWPTNISRTKRYLLDETVPALQALAQKLVVHTLSTTTLTTSLGILMYLSSFGIYESGAVAALGGVWALRRMQKKWETAREYWEGEVREEGRKAVRAVEASFLEVLDREKQRVAVEEARDGERRKSVEEKVGRAEAALAKLK